MAAIRFILLFGYFFLLSIANVNASPVKAPKYDFAVENNKGQIMFFHIISKEDHSVSITKGPYIYRDEEYDFPDKVEFEGVIYDVVAVADKAFYERDNIRRITLPNTVRSIGYDAFADCDFSYFVFPDSLKEIKDGAFNNTFIEENGLVGVLPKLVGKYFTKQLVKGGYRIHKASFNSVCFKNDVTGVITELSDLRNLEDRLFENDLVSYYQPVLTRVERTDNPDNRYSGLKEVESDNISWFNFDDDYIDMSISGTAGQYDFKLKNKTANTIKIIWDDAVYVNVDGNISKVIHKGVKFSEREGTQVSSSIIRGASLSDIIVPTVFIKYLESIKEWKTWADYPEDSSYEGKNVSIMLPIQIKDVVNEYLLEFTLLYLPAHPERLK